MTEKHDNAKVNTKKKTGPFVYQNWMAISNGAEPEVTYEYPLYSDAHIVGEHREGLGPYQLLNGLAFGNRSAFRPGVILRAKLANFEEDVPGAWTTDVTNYHGGEFEDEVAALISLSLGIRVKAGPMSREFQKGGDPLGMPWAVDTIDLSTVPLVQPGLSVLPYAVAEPYRRDRINLKDVDALQLLPDLKANEATALVLAARTYQNALLVAEGEPELAWLLLVSAVETAAVHWSPGDDPPLERLKGSKQELYDLLFERGGDELAEEVATMIVDSFGVTSKFLRFLLTFLPEPPPLRPEKEYQVSWSETELKKILRKVYDYRSTALHTGRPFPAPMCAKIYRLYDLNKVYDSKTTFPPEKPVDLARLDTPIDPANPPKNRTEPALRAKGGTWTAKDAPILLHPFEYIVRRALLAWCHSMADKNQRTS